MIKPQRLKKGDTVAIVSLSSGLLGEPNMLHKLTLGTKRLEEIFGLHVITMPHALKGIRYLQEHPEARAQDLMDALQNPSVKAIICAIGGNDTYKLLPYIDFEIIKNNPKIFMGFSDSTTNHLMFYKAGVTSFYGPNLMCNFAQYGAMYDYEIEAIKKVLFENTTPYEIKASAYWSKDFIPWDEQNIQKTKTTLPNTGYELLQGQGVVQGCLLGGCIDSLGELLGIGANEAELAESNPASPSAYNNKYHLFPTKDEWKNKILFIETSEEKMPPETLKRVLLKMKTLGVIDNINGILVGKPQGKVYYEEYKKVYQEVIGTYKPNLPILYNVNFGHAEPINIIPYGINCELNCNKKTITILENMLN